MDHDPGQRHNIYNLPMLAHTFLSKEDLASSDCVMWPYGLCHILDSMSADSHRRQLLLSFHGGGGGASIFGPALLAWVPGVVLW